MKEPILPPPPGPTNAALIRRLLAISWRYRRGCIKVLVLQSIILSFDLFAIGLSCLGLDEIAWFAGVSHQPPGLPFHLSLPFAWTPMEVIGSISAAVLILGIIRGLIDYLYRVAANQLVQAEIVVHLRSELYDKLQRLSFRFFDANASGSIINRVTGDVQAVRMFVDNVVLQAMIMVLSLATYLVYMLNTNVPLTAACLATTPLIWVASTRFSSAVQPASVRSRELVDQMIQRLAENIRGVHVVKAFAREKEEIEKFRESNEIVRTQKRWIFKKISIFTPAVGFLSQVNIAVLLCYGGYLVVKGELAVGTGLLAFANLLQRFATQISNIAGIANSMQESLTGARRVFEVLDAPLEVCNPVSPVSLGKARGKIEFDRVWFDHGRDPVVRDVTFTVEPGQVVAMVGPTGSGKSVIMSLIPRFYDPTAGSIRMDGIDLRQIDLDELRRNVGLVFQESFLFSTTVAANIAFGHPHATRAQIENAARIASAHDFITALPKGYDTVLGEGGVGLSGGQRQRLAIARAVLLEPPLLLLDDPTAAVDPGTEFEIIEAMASAMESRTTFIVAHRLSILRRADLILVIHHGRIVQVGTHDDLMNKRGYYLQAAQLQVADRETSRFIAGARR